MEILAQMIGQYNAENVLPSHPCMPWIEAVNKGPQLNTSKGQPCPKWFPNTVS
jgi:hypothetical protein